MGYQFDFLDPNGKVWRLATGEDGVALAADNAPGPKSSPTESRAARSGGVGETVNAVSFPQMTGTIVVGLDPHWMEDSAGVDVANLRADFVAAWEATSHTNPGLLTVVRDDGERFTCSARLGPGGVSDPGRSPASIGFDQLTVDVVSDDGLWSLHRKSAKATGVGTNNKVTVTNKGDTQVWPEITWIGSGREVIVPSGARITLPNVTSRNRMYLDPNYSCEIVDDATGVRNEAHTRAVIASGVFPEPVPNDGKPYNFMVSQTVQLEWRIGVRSPWR